jgi:hypothetical protein
MDRAVRDNVSGKIAHREVVEAMNRHPEALSNFEVSLKFTCGKVNADDGCRAHPKVNKVWILCRKGHATEPSLPDRMTVLPKLKFSAMMIFSSG